MRAAAACQSAHHARRGQPAGQGMAGPGMSLLATSRPPDRSVRLRAICPFIAAPALAFCSRPRSPTPSPSRCRRSRPSAPHGHALLVLGQALSGAQRLLLHRQRVAVPAPHALHSRGQQAQRSAARLVLARPARALVGTRRASPTTPPGVRCVSDCPGSLSLRLCLCSGQRCACNPPLHPCRPPSQADTDTQREHGIGASTRPACPINQPAHAICTHDLHAWTCTKQAPCRCAAAPAPAPT